MSEYYNKYIKYKFKYTNLKLAQTNGTKKRNKSILTYEKTINKVILKLKNNIINQQIVNKVFQLTTSDLYDTESGHILQDYTNERFIYDIANDNITGDDAVNIAKVLLKIIELDHDKWYA